MGIRIDEPDRISQDNEKIKYLADISDFTKQDILDFWASMPFDLDLPEYLGNCVFCIKKGINKLALAARDEPKMAQDFIAMVEDKDVAVIESRNYDHTKMFRNKMSLKDIIKLYEPIPRHVIANSIKSNFESGSCTESCEAMGLVKEQIKLF